MANGSIVKKGDVWQAVFRLPADATGKRRQVWKSLETGSKSQANDRLGEIRNTLRKIESGDLEVPGDADLVTFVMSAGKLANKVVAPNDDSLAVVIEKFKEATPSGAKQPNTLATEETHFNWFRAIIGGRKPFRTIKTTELQTYTKTRLKTVKSATVAKELATYNQLWNFAVEHLNIVDGVSPKKGVKIPKGDNKPPFKTWVEIERIVARGGYSDKEKKALVYVILLFGTGQWRRLVPSSWQIVPDAWAYFVHYVTFHIPPEPDTFSHYNALQQLSYFAVVFVLAPLAIVTGLSMSPALTNRFKWYPKLPANRQVGRSIHFLIMCAFVIFIAVHLAMVILTGLIRNMNHIVLGVNDSTLLGLYLGLVGIGIVVALNALANWMAWRHPRVIGIV